MKIQIVGEKVQHDKQKVKDSVVKIGSSYYWKDDRVNLTKITRVDQDGNSVGYRFYRKESSLIVKTGHDVYHEKSACVLTKSNIWILKSSAVKIGDSFYRKEHCIKIGDSYYTKDDPRIVKNYTNNQQFLLKEDCIKLSEKVYSNNAYVKRDHGAKYLHVVGYGNILFRDIVVFKNADNVDVVMYNRDERAQNLRFIDVFLKWSDPNNPDPGRAVITRTLNTYIDRFPLVDSIGLRVHDSQVDEVVRQHTLYVERTLRDDIESIRKRMNANYDEEGKDENTAKTISLNYKTFPGKHVLFKADKVFNKSLSLAKTGGIGYTFGVELETSAGMLSNSVCQDLEVDKMGDRSIGSAEYVTGILHGSNGVNKLKKLCKTISENTFVDNRCGLHIHVGGHKSTDSPTFNRSFNINAIRLGAQIEKDLYLISPETRHPRLKHCHSILRYKDISLDNWKNYLGAYIFGPMENWDNLFNMGVYSYGNPGLNADATVGMWAGSRYKWLNIIHCASKSRIKTIEVRMFSGTTSFDKVYNYLLITLAFTWFIDNRQGLISKGGVTLETVVKEAFSKHDAIRDQVLTFIKNRKKLFGRNPKTLYGNLPFN